jgi:hypothetical protein
MYVLVCLCLHVVACWCVYEWCVDGGCVFMSAYVCVCVCHIHGCTCVCVCVCVRVHALHTQLNYHWIRGGCCMCADM